MNATLNEVNQIELAILNKSKRTFKNKKDVHKQALYFSPLYRDFILKVISNSKLKIVNSYSLSYIQQILSSNEEIFSFSKPLYVDQEGEVKLNIKYTKRGKNKIKANIEELDALPHELGHAVDFWFSEGYPLSSLVIIKDNKTLYDIFTEEFEEKHQEIYQEVMDEYKVIINSNISDNAYDILTRNMKDYNLLMSLDVRGDNKEVIAKARHALQQKLYRRGFVEAYYSLFGRRCYKILNDKYSPILDALSSKYDFDGLGLYHHHHGYYSLKHRAVQEFFANAFAAKVTSKYQHFINLIKYLPKSFAAFETLFDMFHDRLINNKKFTDLTLKERKNINEL